MYFTGGRGVGGRKIQPGGVGGVVSCMVNHSSSSFTVGVKTLFFFFYCMVKIGPKIKIQLHQSHYSHITNFHGNYLRQAPHYFTRHVSIVAGQAAQVATRVLPMLLE